MAETITIPSPSLFLSSPNPTSSSQASNKKSPRRPHQSPKKDALNPSDANGVTKRKQSKSRNGCITCKAKRLKCDETKPSCQQCARRNVQCGGYKKDFKWRSFEEGTFTSKPAPKTKKDSSPPSSASIPHAGPAFQNTYFPPLQSPGPFMQAYHHNVSFAPPYSSLAEPFAIPQQSAYIHAPPPLSPHEPFASESVESSSTAYEVESIDTRPTKTTTASSVSSGQSPRLLDLLLPGTDLSIPPEEYHLFRSQFPESFYQPSGYTPPAAPLDDDNVEEIPRDFNTNHESWIMRLPSPSPSDSSTSSTDSTRWPMLTQPTLPMSSPEMLTRRFDRDTCGILSVKDGPTENPWRTLVWPLARDCPALYHAIASMTSFHCSRDSPMLRIHGIDHMRESVHALAANLGNMRVDAAISTTLVLAFSESWDQHISTGINHIKGAKILIDKALSDHNQVPVQGEEFNRLKFLCNSWIYMDVIARLTSADDDESNDFDIVSDAIYLNGQMDTGLDPLMGCASTLFPIIGRVANLVRKVRRTASNGPSVISQAIELRSQLESWVPPAFIEDPEDESTSPHDSMKTAAAYQYATLLYLHQAVPEVPSQPSLELAKQALCELATVGMSSRSVIVHIYPLMAAGCEMTEEEDRRWVQDRWEMLSQRMKLGIIDKCLEVTKEVWSRRDAHVLESMDIDQNRNTPLKRPSMKRNFDSMSEDADADGLFCWLDASNKRRAVDHSSLFGSPQPQPISLERSEGKRRAELKTEQLHPGATVRGRLHWLGVMKDWNWEVLLG